MSTPELFERCDPAAPGFNMAHLLDDHATHQPNALAVAVGQKGAFKERTFLELNARANQYARALQEEGIGVGDRVILMVRDPQSFFSVVFACSKIGALYVLIDPGMGVEAMVACIKEQKPDALIGIAKAHVLKVLKGKAFKTLKKSFLVDGAFFPGAISLDKRADKQSADAFECLQNSESSDAAIMYTSGSTGIPKGVVFTHAMMGGQCKAIAQMFDLGPSQKHVACFPLFALIAGSIGMGCVIPEMDLANPASADPQKIVDAFKRFKPQSAFGSPAVWEPLSRFLDDKGVSLGDTKTLLTAGAPVQPALHARLKKALPEGDIYTPYGATEALPIAFTSASHILKNTAAKTAQGAGTYVGKSVPGVDVRIIKIDEGVLDDISKAQELSAGEIGEIIVRGPLISKVYDKRPEHTAKAKIKDGDGFWHRMGDVGSKDDEGGIWFCGRQKHRVQTSDKTFFSVPVEAVVENHPNVKRAALTWVGDVLPQRPVVCVELEKGAHQAQTLGALKVVLDQNPVTKGIKDVLAHPGFPVDRRHNAKIEREKMTAFAAQGIS